MTLGYNKPLYILPFDHRATFQTGMFGWRGPLAPEQIAQITAAKTVIYDALKAAVAAGGDRTTQWRELRDCQSLRHNCDAVNFHPLRRGDDRRISPRRTLPSHG
jgi:hypothetical protein